MYIKNQNEETIRHQVNFEKQIVLALGALFMLSGLFKILGAPALSDTFTSWGYPGWFIYFAGAIEVLGALLLLKHKTVFYGAMLLFVTMFAAFMTHWVHGEILTIAVPFGLMGILGAVALHFDQSVLTWMRRMINPEYWAERLDTPQSSFYSSHTTH